MVSSAISMIEVGTPLVLVKMLSHTAASVNVVADLEDQSLLDSL
jgi:hypothetical protein